MGFQTFHGSTHFIAVTTICFGLVLVFSTNYQQNLQLTLITTSYFKNGVENDENSKTLILKQKSDPGDLLFVTVNDKIDQHEIEKIEAVETLTPHTYFNIFNATIFQLTENIEKFMSTRTRPNPSPHIFFLKTHKTASSTVQNILFRYGDLYDLNFAIPSTGNRFAYPYSADSQAHITPNNIRPADDYNLVCHHMRFSKKIFEFLYNNLNYEDDFKSYDDSEKIGRHRVSPPFKFTIVRNPVSLFESSFGYFKEIGYKGFVNARNMESFLEKPKDFYKKKAFLSMFGHNHMMFDLGYSADLVNDTEIETAINEVDEVFDLVLVQDYFEESLILLKNKLNFNFLDIVSFKTNARSQKRSTELSAKQVQKLKSWNKADTSLYDHFNSSFWLKVANYGNDKMRGELNKLNAYTEKVMQVCLDHDQPRVGKIFKGANIQVFNLKKGLSELVESFCENIVREELEYSRKVFAGQIKGWNGF